MKIADLGVSNEFDGADALLTNTAGTPAFTGERETQENCEVTVQFTRNYTEKLFGLYRFICFST